MPEGSKPVVRYPVREDAADILLVAGYSGISDQIQEEVVKGGNVEVVTAEGETLSQPNTCCRYIASLGPLRQQLLGDSPEQDALISEWLSKRHTLLTHITETALSQVDQQLLTRTFLLGNSITLADLVLFAALARAVANFPLAQVDRFVNLVRWYDYLQNAVDTEGLFPKSVFQKPSLKPPPPLPAPAPKPEKGAGEALKPKADGAKAKGADSAAGQAPTASASESGTAPAGPATPAPSAAAPSAEASAAASAASQGSTTGKKGKKEKGGGAAAAAAAPAGNAKAGEGEPTVDALDLRVGQITAIRLHPNAESLYLEDIDLGEEKPRQVISGLVKFVPIEQMQGRKVVVVANLKPAKMRDVMSYGMVLCASDSSHEKVDPINPPAGAAIGERIAFEGYNGEPEAVLNPKKKVFEQIAPFLVTDADGVARYKDVPFMTSAGQVTATIPNATIK
eukprot:jgi/Botrbrau1/200/Bobra.0022s0180.1